MSYGNIKDITAEQFSEMHIIRKMTLRDIAEQLDISPDRLSEHVRKKLGLKIIHKKWYSNGKYCSDFYIKELDLWIEVSLYNDTDYLEKIWNKRRLVNNFIFFNNLPDIIEYFVKNGLTLRKC